MIASQSCALLTAPDWLISTVKIDSRQKVGHPYNFSGGFQSESLRSEVTKRLLHASLHDLLPVTPRVNAAQ